MKVKDYGDMLAQVKGKKCIAFVYFGSYQGEWVAALDGGNNIELWKGYYGSCSGCDWLEAEKNWETDEVSDEGAQKYFKEDHYFIDIPKETMRSLSLEAFTEILPKNIRGDIYEFNPKELYEAIKV